MIPTPADLFPVVTHKAIGEVRVDGIPARFSATPWRMENRRAVPRRA